MIGTASYWEQLEGNKVVCHLCPAECLLTEGKRGICRCRYNRSGKLVTDNYGELVTLALDPIEKKPLYHFHPGTQILSTGPNCCNLGCLHCQNWTISQETAATTFVSPQRLAELAVEHESIGVAFTYTEPMVWFEYIMDVAPLLKERGQKVVLVTNGYINPEPLEELISVTDAMNIDLKGIRREFYLRICKGKIEPVLDTIRRVAASKVHLELTNLIITGENDSQKDIRDLIDFVASVSDRIPVHFSAYHPDYQMDNPVTPSSTLLWAYKEASQRLKHVYIGNVSAAIGCDTVCSECGNTLVRRKGFQATIVGLNGTSCAKCGADSGIRR
jgi:pyruvate formate lyase activating enzyme